MRTQHPNPTAIEPQAGARRPRRVLVPAGLVRRARRRAVASLLAMLYLILISTLAIGFYAATTTQANIAGNEQRVARAYFAAESGMDFMRRQLAKVHIDSSTPPDDVAGKLYNELQNELGSTSNLGGGTISFVNHVIKIPASGVIKLDPLGETTFSATITDWAGEIVCKVDGHYGTQSAARAISMDFTRTQRTGTVFDNAVVSAGQILKTKTGSVTSAAGVDPQIVKMMSAQNSGTSISVSGGTIGGDLTVVDGANVSITGGSVGGSSVPSVILSQHVNSVPTAPEFPTFDPTVFKQYATNTYVSGKNLQKNILVPAGTNPTFNSNDTVQGILYIQSPNRVLFNGDFKLQGFIVMETSSSTTDSLTFKGNITMSPVPNQPQFDTLRSVSGVAIMAPNAAMTMSGSTDSSVKGSIIVKTFNYTGVAGMLVDHGTIMTMSSSSSATSFNGSKDIQFTATGADNQPTAGVSYSQYFLPKPGTYQEVAP